jgi:hypothetical protein
MTNLRKLGFLAAFIAFTLPALFAIAAAQQPPSGEPPANVEGNWTIYSKGDNGRTAEKSVQIKQNGSTLTGHFKGPNQSGGIEGTVNGRHIVFHTKTRNVLTFRGQVEGDTIHGTWGIHGEKIKPMQGEWEGRRISQ